VRKVLIGVLILVGISGLLYAAWSLEDSKKKVYTQDATSPEFEYELEKNAGGGGIVITCSEDIMSKPIAAFARWLHIDGPPLQLPGGHMTLSQASGVTVPDELKAAQRVAIELLKRTSPNRIVLVAHSNCIYYDAVAAWQDNLSAVREKEVSDLKSTAKLLNEWFPKAAVELYLAEEKNGKLVFHKI